MTRAPDNIVAFPTQAHTARDHAMRLIVEARHLSVYVEYQIDTLPGIKPKTRAKLADMVTEISVLLETGLDSLGVSR